jgi:hypothetical protein
MFFLAWATTQHRAAQREETGMRRDGLGLVAGLSLTILVSGCSTSTLGLTASQKAAIGEFSRATAAIGETTQGELTEMRARMVQTNEQLFIIRGSASQLSPAAPLDGLLSVNTIAVVVAAATALQGYGEMLVGLVEDTQASQLQSAAGKFVTSLSNVPNVNLSAGASDAISAVIVFAGERYIEAKKAHALKVIVPETRPAIDRICDTLASDFDWQSNGLAAALDTQNQLLQSAASSAVQDTAGSTDGAAVVARSVSLPALQYAVQTRLRRDEVQKRVQSSVLAIKKANAALADALANDRWSLEDVKEAAGAASELKPAIKELSEQASGLLDRVKILTPFPIMR